MWLGPACSISLLATSGNIIRFGRVENLTFSEPSILTNPFEHIEVGGKQLQSLRFRLTDGNGRVVDMKGRSIAFSVLFMMK